MAILPGRLWLLAVLPSSLALAACRGPTPPTTIRIAHETDVLPLDPVIVGDFTTYSVLSNVCEGLVGFDTDMRLVPALAVSWNAVDDHTWEIELRKGVRFHDGGSLRATDVKLALDRAKNDPASGVRTYLSTVRDVEVAGEHTLLLKMLTPDALLLNRLASVLIGRLPGATGGPDHPVGTGPYRFIERTKAGSIELASFDGYWGGKPSVDRVTFVPLEKERQLALVQRRVDVLESVPEAMLDGPGFGPGIRILAREGLATNYLWLNAQRAAGAANPFADKRVRQAVSLAIDRRELARRLGGHVLPANQLVQKGVFGYIPSFPELAFDPEASRRLLKEAGYGSGFDTTFTYNPGGSRGLVSEAVREMLGAAGIRLSLQPSDWSLILSGWKSGRLPFFLASWNSENGDASSFLKDCLSTRDPARHTGEFNPGFSDPVLDRLIEENAGIFDESRRLAHYDKMMRLAMEEMPVVPLYHRLNFYGVSERVRWHPRLDGKLLVREMSLKGP